MSAEEMAQYTEVLRTYKPAQDKPCTEIIVFKLKELQSPETMEYFETHIIKNTVGSPGVLKQSWAFSLSDPQTFIWQLDWVKIQYHWDFWQTPNFVPVISTINKLFDAGRPLVRHYEFKPAGMLDNAVQRVLVWDHEVTSRVTGDDVTKTLVKGEKSLAKGAKVGDALDMNETNWRCAILGYETMEEARKDELDVKDGDESHILELKFAS